MRVILVILAAYAFAGWNDANAACQRFKPDGTVEACQPWEGVVYEAVREFIVKEYCK